jgi:hypothetical protein
MQEISKPISEWEVPHAFATNICEELTRNHPIPIEDKINVSGTIFCIPINYERTIIREDIEEFPLNFDCINYALYTGTWKVSISIVFSEIALKGFKDLLWSGQGDYDRWMKDATLLRLYGISLL